MSEARRIAVQFAHSLGFTQDQSGKVAIVATEIANNLANHASRANSSSALWQIAGAVIG